MSRSRAWVLCSLAFLLPGLCSAAERSKTERITVSGQVVDEQSRGVAGISVTGITYTDVTRATTDEQGRFTLSVLAFRVSQLTILADDARTDRMGVSGSRFKEPPAADTPLQITLAKCKRLPVEVLDAEGRPAAGVAVGAVVNFSALPTFSTDAAGKAELRLPTDTKIESLYAVKPNVGFDYRLIETGEQGPEPEWLKQPPVRFQLAKSQTIRIRLIDSADRPIADTEMYLWLLNKPGHVRDSFNLGAAPNLFRTRTDADGVAVFQGVPDWNVHPLTFWSTNPQYARERISFDPQKHPDGKLVVTLQRLVSATGTVVTAEGRPAAGIELKASGAGYKVDGGHAVATTDAAGRFEMQLEPDLLYMFAVTDKQWGAPAIEGIVAVPDKPIEGLKFQVRPATRIHGRITNESDSKPIAGQRLVLQLHGTDLNHLEGVTLPNPEKSERHVAPQINRFDTTNANGEFEFFAGPGQYRLWGYKPAVVIADESDIELNFSIELDRKGPFAGTVVAGEPPQPVPLATIEGIYGKTINWSLRLRADAQGRVAGERYLQRTVLYAKSPDGKLAGIVEIGPDDKAATIAINPVAALKARLINDGTGDPLPNRKVDWRRLVPMDNNTWLEAWGGSTTTDDEGNFVATGLVVGQEYRICMYNEEHQTELLKYTPKLPGEKNMGDVTWELPIAPPTLSDRVNSQFVPDQRIAERYKRALEEAPGYRQNILVVFHQRNTPATESWFKLALKDRKVRTGLFDYRVLHVDAQAAEAAALAKQFGLALAPDKLPAWSLRDPTGKALEQGAVPLDGVDKLVDQTVVLEQLRHFAPAPLDAQQLLKDALAEATASDRRVLVQETATWCGPCHMLARYLEAHRKLWEKDYIWVRMDQRWTGCDEVLDKLQEKRGGGIPWCAILDADGKVLATSDRPEGEYGFPTEPDEIEHFMQMLQSTKQRLTELDLATLRKGLEKR
jgi:hypothetical protein